MATKKFYHDIDMLNVGELKGARLQNISTSDKDNLTPSLGAGNVGLQVWDTDLDAPYIWNGSAWIRDALVVTGSIVYKGTINPTNDESVPKESGFQYAVDTAGTLAATGVTFSPSGVVEVGDIVLFTSATEASVFQRNTEEATETSLGIVELATQAEVDAGSDTSKVITPATLEGSELFTVTAPETTINTAAQTITGAINEHETDIGTVGDLTTTAISLTAAVNELDAELGTITAGAMGTTASTVSGAIAELDTYTGNGVTLTTTATTLSAAINEIDALQGNVDISGIGATVTAALAAHESDIGEITDLTTASAKLVLAINELDAELGTITALAMGTTASTVSGAISELEVEIDTLNTFVEPTQALTTTATTLADAVNELDAEIGNTGDLNTAASTIVTAINEHEADIGNMTLTGLVATDLSAALRELRVDIGDVGASGATLDTTATDLAAAINEHEADLGSMSLDTTATDVTAAINEVHGELMKRYFNSSLTLVADTPLTVNHALGLTDKDQFTIRVADSSGASISCEVVSVDTNNLTIEASQGLSNVHVMIIGF